jgi:uncharacterized protein YndB with AHSA1/START domain
MMPVKTDPSGRRYVQSEAEVPGTPETVWQAIATGPGISSWFVPTDMEIGTDGVPRQMVLHFGSDSSMDSRAKVTSWDPPRRYSADTPGETPNAPTVATEWTIEARSGGTCLVRVVHSWFASTDDWDSQYEGTEFGWPAFFRILRVYLTHFRGEPCSLLQFMPTTAGSTSRAWAALMDPLGLSGATEKQQVRSAAGAPSLSGIVEHVGPPDYPELLLRIAEPAPGVAHFFAMPMGGVVCLQVRFYLYGDGAASAAARIEPVWQAWLQERFPAAATPSAAVQES